jgi:type IV pilus assembly protein PilW
MSAHSQQGHTLPELLIGVALGSLVIAAAVAAYSASTHTWTAMTAADAVHANARMALRSLREQTHLAGATYLTRRDNREGRMAVDMSASEQTGQAALTGINGNKYTESITLAHWHALDAADCQGNLNSKQATVSNQYKLNTNKELTCKDLNLDNSTFQALAEGIEDFQLRYAEFNPAHQTIQWKTADQVTAMSQVLAIDVCVRVASINVVNSTKTNANLKGCQSDTILADGRLRRVFKRVTTLRNRDLGMP